MGIMDFAFLQKQTCDLGFYYHRMNFLLRVAFCLSHHLIFTRSLIFPLSTLNTLLLSRQVRFQKDDGEILFLLIGSLALLIPLLPLPAGH